MGAKRSDIGVSGAVRAEHGDGVAVVSASGQLQPECHAVQGAWTSSGRRILIRFLTSICNVVSPCGVAWVPGGSSPSCSPVAGTRRSPWIPGGSSPGDGYCEVLRPAAGRLCSWPRRYRPSQSPKVTWNAVRLRRLSGSNRRRAGLSTRVGSMTLRSAWFVLFLMRFYGACRYSGHRQPVAAMRSTSSSYPRFPASFWGVHLSTIFSVVFCRWGQHLVAPDFTRFPVGGQLGRRRDFLRLMRTRRGLPRWRG